MIIESVPGTERLLRIQQAVDPAYLQEINSVDWLRLPYCKDDHWSKTFKRRVLAECLDVQLAIENEIKRNIHIINSASGQNYRHVGSTWQVCESGFVCPMHLDGHKPNVMIIYWHTPGLNFGTTFYRSANVNEVLCEFPGTANTGFFANYEPAPGEPWPEMWHASMQTVPKGTYRLLTQFEFQK